MLFSLLFSNPLQFFASVIALIAGITVHEFSHALAAHVQGDPTPGLQGRLSLNPLRHLDPFGTLFLLFAGFGWGRPVQFDPRYLKNKRLGPLIVGLAGPAANLAMILLFGGLMSLLFATGVLSLDNGLFVILSALVLMNLVLMIFNLIPIPPLDGSKVLFALLPPSANGLVSWLEQRGPMLLIGLILLDALSPVSILGRVFTALANVTFQIFL